jgi:hypothetical protein
VSLYTILPLKLAWRETVFCKTHSIIDPKGCRVSPARLRQTHIFIVRYREPIMHIYFHRPYNNIGDPNISVGRVSETSPPAADQPVRGALQLQVTPPRRTRSQVS